MNFNGGIHLALFYIAILLCLLPSFSPANAEWHGELSVLSNYVYRGYSKSQGNPVVQGRLAYQNDTGWFGGLGLSQVKFEKQYSSDLSTVEIKPYIGWAMPLSADWRGELSAGGYVYNEKVFGQKGNYAEFFAALHYQDWLSAKVSIAPNAYQRNVTVPTYELIYRRDILDTVRFSAGAGYYQVGGLMDQDVIYWNLGASWFLTPHLALDIRYVDAQVKKYADDGEYGEFYPRQLDNKYLLSITMGF